jgi:hypothetical protein
MRFYSLKNIISMGVFGLVLAVGVLPVQATQFTVQFTAQNFVAVFPGYNVPDDPVAGTVVYNAANINAKIDSLISITLTIDGHTYDTAQVGYSVLGTGNYIGGLKNGVTGIGWPSDDFWFGWDMVDWKKYGPNGFNYMSIAHNGWCSTMDYKNFSITESAPVPIPGALWLLGSGLLGLIGLKRKFLG